MDKKMSRRTVLLRGLQIPIGGSILLGLSACGSDSGDKVSGVLCADPNMMTSAEESVRRTLKYTEISPHPDKTCASCEFYHAGTNDCGTCEMFAGKPVNPAGYCDSWSVDA